MITRLLFATTLVAAGLLSGCRDDDGLSDPFYIDTVTPTPTPFASPTATPFPGVTPTPSPTPPDDGSGAGAPMVSATEPVSVTNFSTSSVDGSVTIDVQRPNAEIWELTVAESPALTIGETLTYQSADQIFGSSDGQLFFLDLGGSFQPVELSIRIQ